MQWLVALGLGALSGGMITLLLTMLIVSESPGCFFLSIAFFGGWGISTWWLGHGGPKLSEVFSRSLLLATGECLALVPAFMVLGGRAGLADQSTEGLEGLLVSFTTAGCLGVAATPIALFAACLPLFCWYLLRRAEASSPGQAADTAAAATSENVTSENTTSENADMEPAADSQPPADTCPYCGTHLSGPSLLCPSCQARLDL